MKIVAMVPIKLNNERLPNKNTLMLGNKPLLQYILDTLLSVSRIDEIYVYCSNTVAKDYLLPGIHFLQRSAELDLDTASITQVLESFSNDIDADIYILAHATAPFIKPDTINICIKKVVGENYDSAFTAELLRDFLWQNSKPLNFDPSNIPRTQDLPRIYKESSGIYVFKKEIFKQTHRRIGNYPYIAEVSGKEAMDIDYMEDFQLAEWYCKKERTNG